MFFTTVEPHAGWKKTSGTFGHMITRAYQCWHKMNRSEPRT